MVFSFEESSVFFFFIGFQVQQYLSGVPVRCLAGSYMLFIFVSWSFFVELAENPTSDKPTPLPYLIRSGGEGRREG